MFIHSLLLSVDWWMQCSGNEILTQFREIHVQGCTPLLLHFNGKPFSHSTRASFDSCAAGIKKVCAKLALSSSNLLSIGRSI